MRDRLAMVGVPALAGLATALVLLGPAQERPVEGARARGVVTRDSAVWALRVETFRHYGGLYAADPGRHVELALAVGDNEVSSWRGNSDEDGVAEARLQLEPEHRGQQQLELRLSIAGRLLSRTVVQPARQLQPTSPLARYHRDGALAIELVLPRGVLAPPFPEPAELRLHTRPAPAATAGPSAPLPTEQAAPLAGEQGAGGTPAEPAAQPDAKGADEDAAASRRDAEAAPPEVVVKLQGGRVQRGELRALGCRSGYCTHVLPLTLIAEAPAVELDIRATRGKLRNRWSGSLNVHNGAIWLDPTKLDDGLLALRSAVPKERVYVSLLTASGRSWGALVPMRDNAGFSIGEFELPAPITEASSLIVAGDAYEPANSASWPVSSKHPMVESKTLSLLADGMPVAERRERQRRARARRPAWGIVLAAGLFELFYLWRRFRISQLKLAQHLREQGGFDPAPIDAMAQPRALTWLVAFSVALLLMFVALAGVAAFG